MKRLSPLLLLLTAGSALAGHPWGGVDICEARRDSVPPGIEPTLLPEPDSKGAALMQRYCSQCHYLPGPGRHTREEWPAVLGRMEMLMGVSSFYRGLLGPVEKPNTQEQQTIAAYLGRNALKPLAPPATLLPADSGEQTYRMVCGDCHAVPDPRRYEPGQWQTVLQRMERHRPTMARPPLTTLQQRAVTEFMARAEGNPAVAGSGHQGVALPLPAAVSNKNDDPTGRWLSLAAFFGLTLTGLWRWRGHS